MFRLFFLSSIFRLKRSLSLTLVLTACVDVVVEGWDDERLVEVRGSFLLSPAVAVVNGTLGVGFLSLVLVVATKGAEHLVVAVAEPPVAVVFDRLLVRLPGLGAPVAGFI